MSIARRLLLASVVLSLVVGGAFVALMLAISALQRRQQARGSGDGRDRRHAETGEARDRPRDRPARARTDRERTVPPTVRECAEGAPGANRGVRAARPARDRAAPKGLRADDADPRVPARLPRAGRADRGREPAGGQHADCDGGGQAAHRRHPRPLPALPRRRGAAGGGHHDSGRAPVQPRTPPGRGRRVLVDRADRALRALRGPLDRWAYSSCRIGREPDRGRRAVAPTARRGTGRGGRADEVVQRDGPEAAGEPSRARAAEREAARERAPEDRAAQHGLARAAHAARERDRLHLAAPSA